MRNLAYKLGLRLSRIRFVRSAIHDHADLHSAGKLLTTRFIIGLVLLPLSFIICWPVISVLGWAAIHFKKPLILIAGGPSIYIISAVGFAMGVSMAGKKAVTVFFRWRARVWVEWLLSKGGADSDPAK
jgi:hypothetical protein